MILYIYFYELIATFCSSIFSIVVLSLLFMTLTTMSAS